ncbi:sensor histidine kinase [Arcanobacterium phocae]|uniref:sensor histidine kinase n=1 Tax=Arcanobacterium phocae TaxID=131112 RepID=UPI001C11D7ED|nr:sensor histidine kinase [Arcanobacterium phocae]
MTEEELKRSPSFSDTAFASFVGLTGCIPLINSYLSLSSLQVIQLWLLSVSSAVIVLLRRSDANPANILFIVYLLLRCLFFPSPLMALDVIVLVMVYSASVYARLALTILVILSALGALGMLWVQYLPRHTWQDVASFCCLLGLVGTTTFAGLARRSQLDQAQKFHAAQSLLQQETVENQRGAVVRERTRIARDLHDIVAHTLGVVIAQADGGRYAGRKDPEQALRALDTIADMSRAALTDIRSIVGVLREPSDETSELSPQPVTHDIDGLVTRVKESGYNIAFIQLGTIYSLPAGIGNVLYRICQESVTNTMKHGGPNISIVIKLEWHENEVTLSIIDNGRGASVSNDGKGNGIIGMTERAALFGGKLDAGARPGGGFIVRATIPYDRNP